MFSYIVHVLKKIKMGCMQKCESKARQLSFLWYILSIQYFSSIVRQLRAGVPWWPVQSWALSCWLGCQSFLHPFWDPSSLWLTLPQTSQTWQHREILSVCLFTKVQKSSTLLDLFFVMRVWNKNLNQLTVCREATLRGLTLHSGWGEEKQRRKCVRWFYNCLHA